MEEDAERVSKSAVRVEMVGVYTCLKYKYEAFNL